MPLTNTGRDALAACIVGEAEMMFDNDNAHLGVGDSTTAFAAAQTDLQAASNAFRKAMDETFPKRDGNVLTFRSTFLTDDANFAWHEWGIFNAPSGGTMLNRKVQGLGTKANDTSWRLTATITVNIGS